MTNSLSDQEKTVHLGYKKIPYDEKVKKVAYHFDSVARQYDAMNTVLSLGIHYIWKRTAIRMAELQVGDRVLDVCGGTGDLSVLATRAVGESGQVVLYDINREMIQAGKYKKTNAAFRKRISYIQGNAEHISFPDCYFDAVTVGFGVRNLTNMKQGFKEMHRVLKPGRKMMCLEFSRPASPLFRQVYDLYSFRIMPWIGEMITGSRQAYTYLPESIRLFPAPDELSAMLEDIGFSRVRYRKLTNGIAVIHAGTK
ncbi:MAG: bifunctional demethylmenaquinone methyltransferase/2-methoxy-6-polyprenyl-1,4-benzoquinol methylase UbiE [Desulfobacteraceae bacterium]|nr:bifunctional demethylmenaquinone methyltransferase/2-methoxy-6-polyprenyl-1,4-benzoquinol methylase UbiE [Desulfobacteraceae bacterium]